MWGGRFRERPKRPLDESELMAWHPSAINLTLLTLTQKYWSRNCTEVTPRPYSSATRWRWNDMWKTVKANLHLKTFKAHIGGMLINKCDTIVPLFHFLVQKTHLYRWYWGWWDIITHMLLYYTCAKPQCDKLNATLQVCDTDEWNFGGMHSAAASSERKLSTNPINKMDFRSTDANFFLLQASSLPSAAVVDDKGMKIGMFGFLWSCTDSPLA